MIKFEGDLSPRRRGWPQNGVPSESSSNQLIVNSCCGATIKPSDKDDKVYPIDAITTTYRFPYQNTPVSCLGIAFFASKPEYKPDQENVTEIQVTLDNGVILYVWEVRYM